MTKKDIKRIGDNEVEFKKLQNDDYVELLLKKRIQQGRRLEEKKTPEEIIQKARDTMKLQLGYFDNTYKRILNPHIYKVSMTEDLRNLKNAFIQERLR